MSLTSEDLEQIRAVFESTISARIEPHLDSIEGRIATLVNGVKCIRDLTIQV